ncbi:MAG: hypothetical protein DRJ66_03935 [Thermoprotei archaeon]|nr:MAG: hypothetical protein DRJ66_03935 [Thermoprotei archaeon]RLF19047.1 MAG: hypothetical protein DRZ82_06970 [Thermoprotei archaeon]
MRKRDKGFDEALRLAVRRILTKGMPYHKLALYRLCNFNYTSKGIHVFMKSLEKNIDNLKVFLLSRILYAISIVRYPFFNKLLSRLRRSQLDNGLWMDYDVNLDYFRVLNDKGIALRITLDILASVTRLGISSDFLKKGILAIVKTCSPEGIWRRTFTKSKAWDVEVTSKALLIIGEELDEFRQKYALSLIGRWLRSSLMTGSCDQPWALGWATLLLYNRGYLKEEELNKALRMIVNMQSSSGYWGFFEENIELTFDHVLILSELANLEDVLRDEVRRIVHIKMRIEEKADDFFKDLKKDVINDINRMTTDLTNDESLSATLHRAFSWAVIHGISKRQNPKPLMNLFHEYLVKYKPSDIFEHAHTIANYVLYEIARLSNRYELLGWLLRKFKFKTWESSPLSVIGDAVASLPNSNQKIRDLYIFALFILIPSLDKYKHEIPCPVDIPLIRFLRKLKLITTPIIVAMRDYGKIREEVQALAQELFPDEPFKLYAFSEIDLKWCKGPTPCVRPLRKGYMLCPFHDLCSNFKSISSS